MNYENLPQQIELFMCTCSFRSQNQTLTLKMYSHKPAK